MSGGRAFFPYSEPELLEACSRIANELRAQYSIAYYPSARPRGGEFRKLKVRLAAPAGLPRMTARTRAGYRVGGLD